MNCRTFGANNDEGTDAASFARSEGAAISALLARSARLARSDCRLRHGNVGKPRGKDQFARRATAMKASSRTSSAGSSIAVIFSDPE
jgi:hypothetical protein